MWQQSGICKPPLEVVVADCGTPNRRFRDQWPTTKRELDQFCRKRGFSLKKLRFYVGKRSTKPKVHGVYRSVSGEYLLHKTKTNRSVEILYRTKSKSEAVHMLFEILCRVLFTLEQASGRTAISYAATDWEIRLFQYAQSLKAFEKVVGYVVFGLLLAALVYIALVTFNRAG